MNSKTILLGLSLLVSATAFSTDAAAYAACDGIEDAKKKEKCEAKEAKNIAKLRSKTTPLKPSTISDKFSALDDDAANPFNMDDYYTGVAEPSGIAALDSLVASVNQVQGAVTMATYIGRLDKDGKSDEAKTLATALLPELIKLKDEIENIKAKVNEIKSNPAALVKDDPKAALKIPGIIGPIATSLPGTIADLPKAIGAVQPLAKGAAGAAVETGVDAAKGAAGDAMPN